MWEAYILRHEWVPYTSIARAGWRNERWLIEAYLFDVLKTRLNMH
jgi:hypothetical protein